MAKYTIEFGNMLCAYANLQEIQDTPKSIDIKDVTDLSTYEYLSHNFNYSLWTNPNKVVDKYASDFIKSFVTDIPHDFTDNEELNNAILDKFLQTFVRHFYGIEIGQENPFLFWVTMQSFLAEHMPPFIQSYQKMMIEKQNFITNVSDSTANNTANANATSDSISSAINGHADTPQDELNFKLNTGDPAQDYNFNYSTDVSGAKSKDNSTTKQDSTADSKAHSEGRNATIMQLVDQLTSYSNGVYLEMFQRAKNYGLFLQIVS